MSLKKPIESDFLKPWEKKSLLHLKMPQVRIRQLLPKNILRNCIENGSKMQVSSSKDKEECRSIQGEAITVKTWLSMWRINSDHLRSNFLSTLIEPFKCKTSLNYKNHWPSLYPILIVSLLNPMKTEQAFYKFTKLIFIVKEQMIKPGRIKPKWDLGYLLQLKNLC